MRTALLCALLTVLSAQPLPAQFRSVYLDRSGVMRWQDTSEEVALFGANYTLPSASDYRAAGYLSADRKKMIDEDMAHFARMGWDALRLSFWGDWENADKAGNLIENEHLDLQDYLIAKARARGIYLLFSPITTYNANWPDALSDTTDPGFSRYYDRGKLGTDTIAWKAQANYIRQILEHVNPYTRTALKDEPAILFIEPINEPWHHPEDLTLSVNYINTLVDAVRSTGCTKLVFYNVSQDFRIAEAIRKSKVQGVTFGWYPSALNSGYELPGNYLRTVDHYDPMLSADLAGLPRIVYEFDSPDLRNSTMYPAMARAFRSVGAQFAAMFAYDMLGTASRNLGWQTHYLNLVYTPRKAMSSVIAAEAMRRLPRMQSYGPYPQNTKFGDFTVNAENDVAVMNASDAYINAGTTDIQPKDPARLRRVAGYKSSPIVTYEGEGAYFLDRIGNGVWRLEVYPDAVPVRDPFEMPRADKVVTRAIHRTWPMRIRLPDLDTALNVRPGIHILGSGNRGSLPDSIARVGMHEFHAPDTDMAAMTVHVDAPAQAVLGGQVEITARVVDPVTPDSVTVFIRPSGRGWFSRYAMVHAGGYEFRARISTDSLREGPHDYVVSVTQSGQSHTFPGAIARRPWDWDFSTNEFFTLDVVRRSTPLRLFRPATDVRRLAFTRIGDAGRTGLFRLVSSTVSAEPALRFELPTNGQWSPQDYTTSLVIGDRIKARGAAIDNAIAINIRLRGTSARQSVHLTLVERDGTSWSVPVQVDSTWTERTISLSELKPARSVMLPQGFPGQWSYWLDAPAGRGGGDDRIRIADVERLQLSMRERGGVEVEGITLLFDQADSYTIDASSEAPPVETGFLKQGTNKAPDGRTLGVTSRYLTRDGKPWLPVMGEFHYSRYPEDKWEEEILKMKAAGVNIVASYVIWIHHEEEKGKFDWSGQRNLRRFVELIGKHGMYAYPRIGPWSHAEVRSGGFPDWLVQEVGANLRSNDSTYLAYVDRFYQQIAAQLKGLLWKEGGPIIGIQLENEYNQRGPKRGEQHILTLKRMALQTGFDVPLYTVTGWDNTVLPTAEVIPVFGGYPDMPWDQSIEELPPGEVYAFRFDNRWAGNMGAQGPRQELNPTAQAALVRYPFLGAEYGGGIQITYHRRPVISADDIAAMLPVQIGSGVNLYGYYMFHGGTNPEGRLTTLHESQRTGYPTDVPVKSYDFQTLIGEFGEVRQSLRKTKLMHYFLNEFGDELAPMVVHKPSRVPSSAADTTVLRMSARTLGKRGFVFFNNYIRNYDMPARSSVQVRLKLPDETLRVPARPIDVPAGAYGVWPVNLNMNGVLLKYSTAQLITRVGNTWYFFMIPRMASELVFDSANVGSIVAPGATVVREAGRVYVRGLKGSTQPAVTLRAKSGTLVRVVVMTEQQAESFWRVDVGGRPQAVFSEGEVYSDGTRVHVREVGATRPMAIEKVREADPIPPVKKFNAVTWRKVEIALAPSDSVWAAAAVYRVEIPADAGDAILQLRWVGDVARLYAGDRLLNDQFFNGLPWRIDLARYPYRVLEVHVLPLRADAPIYLGAAYKPSISVGGQRSELVSAEIIPARRRVLRP